MRPQILGCNQMLFTRPHESFPKIDNHRAPHINFERYFLDRFAIGLEMKAGIRVGAVVHACFNRAKINRASLRDFARELKLKRRVSRPMRDVISYPPLTLPKYTHAIK